MPDIVQELLKNWQTIAAIGGALLAIVAYWKNNEITKPLTEVKASLTTLTNSITETERKLKVLEGLLDETKDQTSQNQIDFKNTLEANSKISKADMELMAKVAKADLALLTQTVQQLKEILKEERRLAEKTRTFISAKAEELNMEITNLWKNKAEGLELENETQRLEDRITQLNAQFIQFLLIKSDGSGK